MLRSLRDDDGHTARLPADQHARPGARTLRFGHDGADVRSLQRVLARLDLLSSKEDGHFGRDTEAACGGFSARTDFTTTESSVVEQR